MKRKGFICEMKIIILVISFIISMPLYPQEPNMEWVKNMGCNTSGFGQGNDIVVDAYGNIYSIGEFYGSGSFDFDPGEGTNYIECKGYLNNQSDLYISKLDANGNLVWTKTISSQNAISGKSLTLDELGNVYITGTFNGICDFDPSIRKYNLKSDNISIYLLKLSPLGEFINAKLIAGTSYIDVEKILLDKTGNTYLIGMYKDSIDFDPGQETFILKSLQSDFYILKLDPKLDFVWVNHAKKEFFRDLTFAIDKLNNIFISGTFEDSINLKIGIKTLNLYSDGKTDIFVLKLDQNGNLLWAKNFGGNSNESISSIALDTFGNVFLAGVYDGKIDFEYNPNIFIPAPISLNDLFIIKLDTLGNLLWFKNSGIVVDDYGPKIMLDINGNAILSALGTDDFDRVTGEFNFINKEKDDKYLDFHLFFLKFDTLGNSVWTIKLENIVFRIDEFPPSIFVDKFENIYSTGAFKDSVNFNSGFGKFKIKTVGEKDIFVFKMNQNKSFKR